MKDYYVQAIIFEDSPELVAVYIDSVEESGNMVHVFDMPLIKGSDLENEDHVVKMIKAHFNNKSFKEYNFRL
jgi:hypothetical protein